MTSASATVPVRRPVLRRVALVLLGVILVVAGALAIAPALVPTETVRTRITEQIEQWLGRPVTFAGDPVITLYPRPTVMLEGVTIGDALGGAEPLVTVERVVGTVALLPLLLGRVEISAFSLFRPEINLRVAADGRSNWVVHDGMIGARLAEVRGGEEGIAGATGGTDVTLGRFLIEDGTITYQRADGPLSEISGVSLDISWPSTAGGMTISGQLTWRSERVAVTGYLGRPLELFGGGTSPARFAVDAAPASLAFDGTISRTALDFGLAGTTSLTTPSLRRLLGWAGSAIPDVGGPPGAAAITGNATWNWPTLAFANGSMSLDGSSAVGSFSVDFSNPRPFIRATLAADVVDLTPYAVSLRTVVEPDGTWVGAPIAMPAFSVLDADLRLSAEELRMGAARIMGIAASATLADGHFLLSLEDATLYGGSLRAAVSGRMGTDLLAVDADVTFAGVALLPALQAVAGVTVLSGTASGTIDAAGSGSTWSDLVAGLTGSISTTIIDGALRGIDAGGATGAPAPRTADLSLGSGGTTFARAAGELVIGNGVVATRVFEVEGAGYRLTFAGEASLLRPSIEGNGAFSFMHSDAEPTTLPFTLGGTWVMPILTDVDPLAGPDTSLAAVSPDPP